jgi:hypothetical protein
MRLLAEVEGKVGEGRAEEEEEVVETGKVITAAAVGAMAADGLGVRAALAAGWT